MTNMMSGPKAEKDPTDRSSDSKSPTGLREKLDTLQQLDAGRLRGEWHRLYRVQAPRLSRDLLIRGVAHRLQELQLGGVSKATRRKLAAFAKELEANGSLAPVVSPQLRPGARLVREWHGRTHTVAVLEDGYEYGGKLFASLTKIAQTITGAHWSGPRFFGLIGKRKSVIALDDNDDAGTRRALPAAAHQDFGGPHV